MVIADHCDMPHLDINHSIDHVGISGLGLAFLEETVGAGVPAVSVTFKKMGPRGPGLVLSSVGT